MKPHWMGVALLYGGLVLSALLGGHVVLGAMPQDPSAPLWQALSNRSVPAIGQALAALLLMAGLSVATLRSGVLQLPGQRLLALLFLLWLWLAASIFVSDYRHQSMLEFARWTVYMFVFVGSVIALGRTTLAKGAVVAIVSGATIAALLGVREYAEMSRIDPNWRVFAGWQNPNAAAGLFALALPAALAVAVSLRSRLTQALGAIAAALCGVALWLTASKGGLLAAAFGLLVFVVVLVAHRALARKTLLIVVACFAGMFLLSGVLSLSARASSQAGPSPAGRIFAASSEAQQSFAFRARLWKDTLRLAVASPAVGVGIGAYEHEIRRYSELQTPRLAHNTYLQIASEAGVPALGLFVLFGASCLGFICKRHAAAPAENTLLRAGIAGAISAAGANMLIESSMSFFGFGVLLFAMCGIGVCLSSDGAQPERAPFASRFAIGVLVSAGVIYYLGASAIADLQTSYGLHEMQRGNLQSAEDYFARAAALQGADPQAPTQLARIFAANGDRVQSLETIRRAIALGPTPGRYKLLGDTYARAGQMAFAQRSYESAVSLDPRNPHWRLWLMRFYQENNNLQAARTAAEQIVAIENSAYIRLNAQPQLVNTDTVQARLFLADVAAKAGSRQRVIIHLKGAYETLRQYRLRTYTELLRITRGDPDAEDIEVSPGYSVRAAKQWFAELEKAAAQLAALYRSIGKPEDAVSLERDVAELRSL